MKIISFTNQKGGVGKTSTCVNLAAALGGMGKKVLLVDMDPQGNASTASGIKKGSINSCIYHALIGAHEPSSTVINTDFNYDIIPANRDLAGAEMELAGMERREWRLQEAILKAGAYDFVLLDCPPSLSLLTINALCASDYMIIPMQAEYYSLEGLSDLINTYKRVREHLHPNLAILGLVLTMFDPRNALAKQVKALIAENFNDRLFETSIPRNIRIAEAPSHGKPSIHYDPKAPGSLAYIELAEELLARFEKMNHAR